VPEVRLIDEQSEQRGVMKIDDALRYAQERDLDLVRSRLRRGPPSCACSTTPSTSTSRPRSRSRHANISSRSLSARFKLRPKIAQHDYETKKGHVERFLRHKDKVKITIMFRGREVTHPERGIQLLDRIAMSLPSTASSSSVRSTRGAT